MRVFKDSEKVFRCLLCPKTVNQRCLLDQHVRRAHRRKANIVSIHSKQALCEPQDDIIPPLEPTTCPTPSYEEESTAYTRCHESFMPHMWLQPSEPYDTVPLNNLRHVFGSWGLSDLLDSSSSMTLVGKQSLQQPDDSSVFLTGGGQTRRDMTDSLFCRWDAAIDYNAVPQVGAI